MAPGTRTAVTGDFATCVDAFVDRAAALRAADALQPIVALVGSHLLRRQLRRLLHERTGGAFNIRLVTFHELAVTLGRPALTGVGLRPVSPLFQEGLVARLLAEKGGYFGPVAHFGGTATALVATFTDLEEAGWSRWPDAAPRRGKLGDLARLFDAYRAGVSGEFFTPQDQLAAAVNRADRFADIFGADVLHVVGIYDANPLQRRLLERLAEHVAVQAYVPDTLQPPPLAVALGGHAAAPWTPPPDALRVWSCPSEAAEVEAIVRRVLALRREGVGYHEMAVLLRDGSAYTAVLIDTCRRAEVPLRLTTSAPVHAPSLRALVRLLGLLDTVFGRAAVIAFLTSVQLPLGEKTDRWRATQAQWDAISRLARVRRDDDWHRRLRQIPDLKGVTGAQIEASRHLRTAAKLLRDGLDAVAAAKTYAAAAQAFTELARTFVAADEPRDAALEGVATLAEFDRAGLALDLARFAEHAQTAIRGAEPALDQPGGLLVADWIAARGLRHRVVFVPGCVEGAVPKPPRVDPILLDPERDAVAEAAGRPGALPTTPELAREELRLFDLVLSGATERLWLSYPRLDAAEGRRRLPSHLLLTLLGRVTGETITYDQLPQHERVTVLPAGAFAPDDPADGLDLSERDLAAVRQLPPPARVAYLLRACGGTFGRAWQKQLDRFAARDVTAVEGRIADPAARAALAAWLAAKKHWSVGEIEKYALCPRRYLFDRVLGLASPDDPEQVVALTPADRGSLVHDMMEEAVKSGHDTFTDELAEVTRDLYQRLAGDNLTGGGLLDVAESARLAVDVQRLLGLAVEQSAEFADAAPETQLEVEFDLPPGMPRKLVGRIDRVDKKADAHVRVVDYKTGKAKNKLVDADLQPDDLNAGSALQIVLYAEMLARAWGLPHVAAVEAAYWHLRSRSKKDEARAVPISAAAMATLREQLPTLLTQLTGGVADGCFVPRPDVAATPGNDYCKNCDFTALCDAQGRAVLAFKSDLESLFPWLDTVGRVDASE